jgi:hypothetical protein
LRIKIVTLKVQSCDYKKIKLSAESKIKSTCEMLIISKIYLVLNYLCFFDSINWLQLKAPMKIMTFTFNHTITISLPRHRAQISIYTKFLFILQQMYLFCPECCSFMWSFSKANLLLVQYYYRNTTCRFGGIKLHGEIMRQRTAFYGSRSLFGLRVFILYWALRETSLKHSLLFIRQIVQ